MIAAINVRGWQTAFRHIFPEDFLDQMDPGEREPLVDQMLSKGHPYHVAVVEDNGKVVGYVMLGPPRSAEFNTSKVHELYSLYIEPDRTGTGLGQILMDDALKYLQEGGWEAAVLWTPQWAGGTARFYEKAGWYLDGAEKTEEIPAGNPVTQVRYRIDL